MNTTNSYQHIYKTIPRDFFGWLLLIFVIGSLTLTGSGQLRSIGMLLTGSYTLYFLKNKLSLPKEMMVFVVWVVWSGTTGYLASIDQGAFSKSFRVVFQIMLMSLAIMGITANRRSLNTNCFGLVIGGIILFLSSYISGELSTVMSNIEEASSGITGLTQNQNTYAFHLLICASALLYCWKNNPSLIKRIITVLLLSIFLFGIIVSASRKAFLGFTLLIFLWLFFCYRKELLRRVNLLIPILLALGGLYFATDYMLSNTYMGKRFKGTVRDNETRSFIEREDQRMTFYKEGFEFIKQSPIFGIGLGNFAVYSSLGKESHSDYLEVATSTGIIGFFMYFSIYLLLWRRLSRIEKKVDDPLILYNIRLSKVIILTILAMALGKPNITSQIAWVVLASIIGYAWSLEKSFALSQHS